MSAVEWKTFNERNAHAFLDGEGLCRHARVADPTKLQVVPSNDRRPIGLPACNVCEDALARMKKAVGPRRSLRGHNPRYVEFARVHGRTPENQLRHDVEAWPGGKMAGYILWLGARLREFLKSHPEHGMRGGGIGEVLADNTAHRAFDAWLHTLPEGYAIEFRSATEYAKDCARKLTIA